MNDYSFDYMNYITNIPNNQKMNLNKNSDNYKMNFNNNDSLNMQMLNNNSYNNEILEPYNGFVRGNMFGNLYQGYKNYRPQNINPQNEREALLNQWQQYNFATVDLNLYLDTHPNDTNALKLFNNYNNILKQITKKYEDTYGPLKLEDANSNNSFNWVKGPWPWESGV